MDAPVSVGIQKFQSFGIEFESGGGAAEYRPLFPVEICEVCNVGTILQFYPDGTSHGGVLPIVVLFHIDQFY